VLLLERSSSSSSAGAAPVAALLEGLVPGAGPVCAVLAGGNIDATTLMSVTRFGLTTSGRYLVVAILIPDRPGQLAEIVGVIAGQRANVLAVTHYREGRSIGVLETEARPPGGATRITHWPSSRAERPGTRCGASAVPQAGRDLFGLWRRSGACRAASQPRRRRRPAS
jgi:hypothetical protein